MMVRPFLQILLLTLFIFLTGNSYSQTPKPKQKLPVVGPEKGTVLAVGGGRSSEEIYLRFIELAGGKDAPIVVIPTAGGSPRYGDESGNTFRQLGATNVTVVHTYDRKVADTDAFIEPITKATGVWYNGGRQWRIVDAYHKTKTEAAIRDVLSRDGVVGGSSAGATILGSYLVRGDTKTNQIMMGDHEVGFGYLKNTAIDQHVIARNRHFDLFEILKKKPELLGIGIDEATAIEVKGDNLTVLGASYVLIYDRGFWSREGSELKKLPSKENRFYFLKPGDRYNLRTRTVGW